MKKMKKAILTMGLPGAGKSYVLHNNFDLSGFVVIDPDEIKKEKDDYCDSRPEVYHEWSKQVARERTSQAIKEGRNLVIDGTGTNVPKMVKQIEDLQKEGYFVEILYVKVRLETSLRRNRERPRTVPEEIIYEKWGLIETSFSILKTVADKATVIEND